MKAIKENPTESSKTCAILKNQHVLKILPQYTRYYVIKALIINTDEMENAKILKSR